MAARLFRKVTKPPALSPGTVSYVGEQRMEKIRLTVFDYDAEGVEEREVEDVGECFAYKDTDSVSWINVDGLHMADVLVELGEHYGLHPLVLEDVVNTRQRPKLEEFEDYIYIVFRMVMFDQKADTISTEQINMVLGHKWLLSFQEVPGDVFDLVRERVRAGKGRARRLGPDYLAYALLDAVVDHYYIVLEQMGERIEQLEDQLTDEATAEVLQDIHELKREMVIMRRSIWPMREVVSAFTRLESPLVSETTLLFARDVYDHTIQVVDAMESFRDILSGLQDLYMTSMSNRMNEVMKVLTIAATIFVPLTFIAGIYGMNFEHMPELGWKWSYGVFWVIIVTAASTMLALFKRKKWL